jgi:hypothetical protein
VTKGHGTGLQGWPTADAIGGELRWTRPRLGNDGAGPDPDEWGRERVGARPTPWVLWSVAMLLLAGTVAFAFASGTVGQDALFIRSPSR